MGSKWIILLIKMRLLTNLLALGSIINFVQT